MREIREGKIVEKEEEKEESLRIEKGMKKKESGVKKEEVIKDKKLWRL